MSHRKTFDPSRSGCPRVRTALLAAVAAALGCSGAQAQPVGYPPPTQNMTFSVDNQGPTASIGIPDSFYGIPIDGGDILTPFPPGPPGPNPPAAGPLPPTGEFITNPPVGGPTVGLNIAPGQFGPVELDALSYGHDPVDVPFPDQLKHPLYYAFSVDEFAVGLPGSAVRAEGALGNQQASADTFIIQKPSPLPAPPVAAGGGPGTNYAFTDGDGLAPSGQPGVGLIEPNPPTPFTFGNDLGDNLDAVDFDTALADRAGPVYFSLDSAFIDPLEVPPGGGPPPNYGTALANGFVGGDVLVGSPTPAGGPIALYAAAGLLGLDLVAGPDSDDLDALDLWENGVAGYQPSQVPFDWLGGNTDMLLFSVRRGSALIGLPDSIWGVPIEEGDILTTPCLAGTVLPSGVVCAGTPFPGIFTGAEQLGLATVRSGTGASWGVINPAYNADIWADDLDALDQKVPAPAPLALMLAGLGALGAARRRRSV
jgi:hypothetical protein